MLSVSQTGFHTLDMRLTDRWLNFLSLHTNRKLSNPYRTLSSLYHSEIAFELSLCRCNSWFLRIYQFLHRIFASENSVLVWVVNVRIWQHRNVCIIMKIDWNCRFVIIVSRMGMHNLNWKPNCSRHQGLTNRNPFKILLNWNIQVADNHCVSNTRKRKESATEHFNLFKIHDKRAFSSHSSYITLTGFIIVLQYPYSAYDILHTCSLCVPRNIQYVMH